MSGAQAVGERSGEPPSAGGTAFTGGRLAVMAWGRVSVRAVALEVCQGAASFLQSAFWACFKGRFGWTSRAFSVTWGGLGETPLLVMTRPLAAGLVFAYVPWGPELPAAFPEADFGGALVDLAAALKAELSRNTAFLRFDPPWFTERGLLPLASAPPLTLPAPFRRAAADIQPPDTVILDLRAQPEAILGRMHSKWRYNVRLGGRKVSVRCVRAVSLAGGGPELDVFYRLFVETARRDGIACRSKDYYRVLFETAAADPSVDARLYIARINESAAPGTLGGSGDIAAIVTLFRDATATYLYGASANEHRNLMAPYALQWQAIQDARAAGCREYDLFGIPPNDDPRHPMAGLYRFKTGFGGRIIHRPGSWDYPLRLAYTSLFHSAEKLRKTLRDLRKPHPRRAGGESARL